MNYLSQTAFSKACKLAIDAAKNDSWMEPLPQEHHEKDYSEFTQAHQAAWEETNHFEVFYYRPLKDLADQQARRFKFDKENNWEMWYYEFFLPLKDAFWEEWEEKVGLHEKWKANECIRCH